MEDLFNLLKIIQIEIFLPSFIRNNSYFFQYIYNT